MAHELAPMAAKDQPTRFPCEACGSPDGMANEIKGAYGAHYTVAACRDCGHEIDHWLTDALPVTAPMAPDAARILEWLDGWSDTEGYAREAAAIIRAQGVAVARLREALERIREAVRMECLMSEDLMEADPWVGYAAMRAAAARIGAALAPPDPPDGGVA